MFGPRGSKTRISELFETLKSELVSLNQEASHYKMQCDEYERKMLSNINDIKSVHNTLNDLERRYTETQRRYDELMRVHNPSGRGLPSDASSVRDREQFSFADRMQNKSSISFPPISSDGSNNMVDMQQQIEKRRMMDGNSSESLIPRLQMPNKMVKLENHAASNADDEMMMTDSRSEPKFTNNKSNQPLPSPATLSGVVHMPSVGTNVPLGGYPSLHHVPASSSSSSASSSSSSSSQHHSVASRDSQQALPNLATLSNLAALSQTQQNASFSKAPPSKDSHSSVPPAHNIVVEESTEYRVVRYNDETNTKLELAHEFEHASVVCCVKFSKDGKYLATGSNRKARIFSVADGTNTATFSETSDLSRDLYLRSVCFSPDGKYLACGAEDKTIKLWDIERKSVTHVFNGHSLDIYSLDYSPDGRFLVSGSGDKKARIWDVENRKCLFILGNDEVGPKDGVTSVAVSPDGRLVAAGSLDRIIRIWDTQTGYFLERYEGHSDSVYSVAFSPDGRSLASGSLDKTLKLWDLSESRSRSRCRSVLPGHTDFVLSVGFSGDGNWLVSGSKDRSVLFWDPRTSTSHLKLEGHKNSVISVAVNPTNGTVATGSGDSKAKIWRYSSSR